MSTQTSSSVPAASSELLGDLVQLVPKFDISGSLTVCQPHGHGHIHDTFLAVFDHGGTLTRYIHQRINRRVFKNPPVLMENIGRVTRHLRSKLEAGASDGKMPAAEISRRTLTIVPTRDGAAFHVDRKGDYWRTYMYIENSATFDTPVSPAMAYEAARAFGQFQMLLSDLPAPPLHETIPRFHHTPSRFQALTDAVARDAVNRAGDVRAEIAFALSRETLSRTLTDGLAAGELPLRVTHNDTKLNNVMFDEHTEEGLCVIDLDTVMPGLALYDFGDLVRSGANPTGEDERNLEKVNVAMPIFEALTNGYIEAARALLTPAELRQLVRSAQVITFENGLRFLADHLSGDVYFKIHRQGHNLDRTRVMFRLLQSMEEREAEMLAIVDRAAG